MHQFQRTGNDRLAILGLTSCSHADNTRMRSHGRRGGKAKAGDQRKKSEQLAKHRVCQIALHSLKSTDQGGEVVKCRVGAAQNPI